MTVSERRDKIIELLRESSDPIPGVLLGKMTGVSRQVIVLDIAFLKREGIPILSTVRGYVLDEPHIVTRVIKFCHNNDQIEDELNTIVDLGGAIVDIMVNHRIYGKLTAPLNIKSRRDIKLLMRNIKTGKSTALFNITAGYHFHTIAAENEETLDEIETTMREKKYLAPRLPYEL